MANSTTSRVSEAHRDVKHEFFSMSHTHILDEFGAFHAFGNGGVGVAWVRGGYFSNLVQSAVKFSNEFIEKDSVLGGALESFRCARKSSSCSSGF